MRKVVAGNRAKLFIKSVLGEIFRRVIFRESLFRDTYIILMYHRVRDKIGSEFDDPALSVSLNSFKMHIKEIVKAFEIVSLPTVLRCPETQRGMCAITFDDGWIDTYEVAFPILKKENLPATVFIPTGLVGKNDAFWFDSLGNLAHAAASRGRDQLFVEHFRRLAPDWRGDELSGENLNNLIPLLKKLPADILADEIRRGFDAIGIQPDERRSIINWDNIEEMGAYNIHFGSHGMRHYILPTLETDLKKEEIFGSLEVLRKISRAETPLFSYPNGDWDDESLRHVIEAGYEGAVTTQLGLNNKETNPFLMNRVGFHEAISNTPSLFWFGIFQAYLAGRKKMNFKEFN